MSQAVALDHVGIVGRDVTALATEFERLGFLLTPLARHAGGRTGNRNIMLRHGYVELLSVVDGGHSATLDQFLARYAGIHILALGIDDATATLARLHRAGFAEAAVTQTDRAVDDADPAGPRARFTLVTTPDPPEGRIHLIHHLTPEAIWRPAFLQHPNHAVGLEDVMLVAAEPATIAARMARLAGRPVVPDSAGGYRLELPRGSLRILPPATLASVLPDIVVPALPWIAGITLRTDDATKALRCRLDERAIRFRVEGDAVLLCAGGVTLLFR